MVGKTTTIFILFLAVAFSATTIVYVIVDSVIEKHGGGGNARSSVPSNGGGSHLDTRLHRQKVSEQRSPTSKTRVEDRRCLDFYEYACDRSGGVDVFASIQQENLRRMKEIVVGTPQLREFTALCTSKMSNRDSTINYLLSIVNPKSYDDLAYIWGRLHLYGVVVPLNLIFAIDPWNATRRIPSLRQSGVFDYEFEVSGREHRKFVAKIFDGDDSLWVDSIINIERALYSIFERSGDEDENLLAYLDERGLVDVLDNWRPLVSDRRFNVTNFFRGCCPSTNITENEWCARIFSIPLWCRVQRYLAELPTVILKFTLETWIAYTRFAILAGEVRYHSATVGAYPHQYDARLEAQKEDRRFEEIAEVPCNELVLAYLPDVVNQEYRRKYLDTALMLKVTTIAEHVRQVYIREATSEWQREKLRGVSFDFGDSGRASNRSKVNGRDFSELIFGLKHVRFIEDFLGFYRNLPANNYTEDSAVTQTSAYYQQQTHRLVLSLGLLQSPFIDVNSSDVFFYARLGVVIAHELSHALDFVGVNFNFDGSYRPVRENNTKATCLEREYSAPTKLGNLQDGRKTINENFADVQGLKIAYTAFLDGVERNDDERRQFFIVYAQQFCRKPARTKQLEFEQLRKSGHSLPQTRVNKAIALIEDYSVLWKCAGIKGCL